MSVAPSRKRGRGSLGTWGPGRGGRAAAPPAPERGPGRGPEPADGAVPVGRTGWCPSMMMMDDDDDHDGWASTWLSQRLGYEFPPEEPFCKSGPRCYKTDFSSGRAIL